jgi:ABC-2 type transport system ATP-binding protein
VAGFDIVREGPKVRAAIGAALQEAALDPLLTGREHLRLQTGLHGFSREERTARTAELLERVGLVGAADRRVRTYSGGMKRRLDLALALVHRPRILFLDEPTTGLDPQSRSALWQEVGRLAKDEGVTIFLTTQYLEEADVLADRVGIIDRGHIVAEGTPTGLKAEIGRPSVEAVPAKPAERERLAATLARFGEAVNGSPTGVSVRLERTDNLVDVVRCARRRGAGAGGSSAPRSEPRRRVPRQDGATPGGCRGRGRRGMMPLIGEVVQLGRRSVVRTLRQPANVIAPSSFRSHCSP